MANIFSSVFIGTAAGVFTSVSLLPQVFKMLKEKKSQDVPVSMLAFLFFGLGLWICYGIMKDDLPLIITNVFSLSLNCFMIFLSIRYKKKGRKK